MNPQPPSSHIKKKLLMSPLGFFFGVFFTVLLFGVLIFLLSLFGYTFSAPNSLSSAELDATGDQQFINRVEEERARVPTETAREIQALQVSPTKPYGDKVTDMRTLSKGFSYESTVDLQPGETCAAERESTGSYKASYTLSLRQPKPALTFAEVSQNTPQLADQLLALPELLQSATVNPYWHKLYRMKNKRTADNAHYLLKLLTKHNYYDCQTILNLRHPETKRRALLLQGDMDVVADGSDGDRLPTMPEEIVTSTHYQPTTSYSWEKQTSTPNPMVAGYEERIQNADAELLRSDTPAERQRWLKGRKKMLQKGIAEMKKRSYLIAEYDPFIVLPVPVIVAKDSYSPNVGDYAIVFYKGKAYPAIVGDAGPEYKVGEASLRIAKTLNPKASPYYRAVSDVNVSYLVFPGTRKKPFSAPDYEDVREQCLRLVEELGGLANPERMYRWKNLFPAPLPAPQLPAD